MKAFCQSRNLFIALAGALLLALTFHASAILAQSNSGAPPGSRLYNPSTEITVSGTVTSVSQVTGRRGWAGTHLQFNTGEGNLDVHVGPSWYLQSKNFPIAAGDKLEITGSKVQIGDKQTLLSRRIVKGDTALTLRDDQGFPVWSRRGGF